LAGLPVIAITNQSTVLTDEQVIAVLPALQHQVSLDFYGIWGADCTLDFLAKDEEMIKGWWQIVIVDDPDQAGALGYHELSSVGTPLGKVFAKLDLSIGASWTVTLSHELLEMLVDPWINYMAQGADGKIYALEVADAVESDALGYPIDGVLVSDFITPSWFEPTAADRYDFMRHVSSPFTLAPGGYISILSGSGWTQVNADKSERTNLLAPEGSRRYRRVIAKREWRLSKQ
jgi:hypothetical protein